MGRVVSAHQPNYIPWLGYFHKMTYSDVFVFLDSVQYTPKTYTNRSVILCQGKELRLIVPVHADRWDVAIDQAMIDTAEFAKKHLGSIRQAYAKARHVKKVMELLEPAYSLGETSLAAFNILLIERIAGFLDLSPTFVKLSDLPVITAKNQLLIDLTKACSGDLIVSGSGGGKAYITGNESMYSDAGIGLAFQDFRHPVYPQGAPDFVPGMSVIDLLCHAGEGAREYLGATGATYDVVADPKQTA